MLRLVLSLLLVFATADCKRSIYQRQRKFVGSELAPHAVEQDPTTEAKNVRTLKVRVYADQDYVAQVMRWQAKFEQLLRRVNQVIATGFAVELELESARAWQRSTDSSDHAAVVGELYRHDPGNDVDWVIALITGVPRAEISMRALGFAGPFTKHIVIRAINDGAERAALSRQLTAISDEELETLYAERKAHKELIIFLHEWGHTLGALHASGREWIMNPNYDPWGSRFGEPNARVIARSLESKRDGWTAEGRAAVTALYKNKPWQLWHDSEIAGATAAAQRARSLAQATPSDLESAPSNLPPRSAAALREAEKLRAGGKHLEAQWKVDELLELHPEDPALLLLDCQLLSRSKEWVTRAIDVCTRAAEANPESVAPMLALSQLADGDAKTDYARQAHDRLARRSSEIDSRAEWQSLAWYYQQHDLVTFAEEVVGDSKGHGEFTALSTWANTQRRRYGLPADRKKFSISPEQEGGYLKAVRDALADVYGRRYKQAEAAIRSGLRRYPRGPGFLVVQCELALRQRKTSRAEASCKKALRIDDGQSWAHLILGTIAEGKKQWKPAAAHFERALTVDPTLSQAWNRLLALCRTQGWHDKAAELEKRRGQLQ